MRVSLTEADWAAQRRAMEGVAAFCGALADLVPADEAETLLGHRNREHGSGLGKFRWFVERTISWLHSFGRLRRRLDRLTEIQEAFLRLGCSLICLRFLPT